MKKYLFGGLFILRMLLSTDLMAQSPSQAEMPKLTPRSPEAAAMDKYGEYPVSMFTGIPEISIPLFEIKTKNFSVPITLNYHASGIKVNEFAPWVGLGWSLDAGGRISTKVTGKCDLNHTRLVKDETTINPQNSSDHLYLQQIANATDDWDPEPDIYAYSIPGKSGRYLYDNSGNPIIIPYSGVKVGPKNNPNKIIDEKGNIYRFDQPDVTATDYPSSTTYETSWLLTKIIDHGSTDSITFSYQSVGSGELGIDYVDYVTIDDQCTYEGCPSHKYHSGVSNPVSYNITIYGNELVQSQINFTQGLIKFIPSSANRIDRPNPGGTGTEFKSLDRIEVYSADDLITPYRTIYFYSSYFINTTSDKRLRLDSLRIVDKSSQLIQRFRFGYNTTINLPSIDSKSKDYWGYFNNRYNNVLLPQMSVEFIGDNYSYTNNVTIGSSNIVGRDPDPNYNQAYILTKIIYPTGGYTTFEYETNKYLDGQTPKYAGGLRIAKIRSYNENELLCTQKTYKYGSDESGFGRFNVLLSDYFFATPPVNYKCQRFDVPPDCQETVDTKRSRTFTSNPCTDLEPYDGSPVVYPIVTEYVGDITTNIGKTIYHYLDEQDGIHVGFYESSASKIFKQSRSFRRGLLDSKTIFKNYNGSYRKIYSERNTYFAYPVQILKLSFMASQVQVYECTTYPELDYHEYAWCNGVTYVGDNLLTSTLECNYDMNDTTKYQVKTTNFSYNSSKYTQVSSQSTTTSTQDVITTSYIYTTEDTTAYLKSMRDLNMIAIPIKEFQIKNQSDSLYSKRTNYSKRFWNKFFSPTSIDFKKFPTPWGKRIYFNNYDQGGNLLSVNKDNDIKICYAYDSYNQVIAEVANADTNTFYCNNFENSDGNSQLNDCKTGRKSRNGGFSKALTGLQNGTYILSWWSGSSGVWSFNSLTIPVSNNTYTISLTGQIDDIRFYLNTSTMKTYTYDPLVGITSVTDENNVISYFEYDAAGRLIRIKDLNSKVLKEYKYNYVNH